MLACWHASMLAKLFGTIHFTPDVQQFARLGTELPSQTVAPPQPLVGPQHFIDLHLTDIRCQRDSIKAEEANG